MGIDKHVAAYLASNKANCEMANKFISAKEKTQVNLIGLKKVTNEMPVSSRIRPIESPNLAGSYNDQVSQIKLWLGINHRGMNESQKRVLALKLAAKALCFLVFSVAVPMVLSETVLDKGHAHCKQELAMASKEAAPETKIEASSTSASSESAKEVAEAAPEKQDLSALSAAEQAEQEKAMAELENQIASR